MFGIVLIATIFGSIIAVILFESIGYWSFLVGCLAFLILSIPYWKVLFDKTSTPDKDNPS